METSVLAFLIWLSLVGVVRAQDLVDVGNPATNLLGLCEGECDVDADCLDGLVCFQQQGMGGSVPGCNGVVTQLDWDYCITDGVFLADVGNPANQWGHYLGLCEGECDVDADCYDGLVCFQQGMGGSVPGCNGVVTQVDWGYCITDPDIVFLVDVGNPATNLGLCEGDCDSDADCRDGLVCFQQQGSWSVPGCGGRMTLDWDYCVPDYLGDDKSGGCDLEITGLFGETYSGGSVAVLNGLWQLASDGSYTRGSMTLALASDGTYWAMDGNWQEYGFCYATPPDDVFSCSGNWISDLPETGSFWSYDDASFGDCGALANVDHPCFENFASVMQFRVNASHAGHEFERVALAGCHNNAPQWTAQRSDSSSLRLMFEDGQWVIYEVSLISEAKYVCAEEGLDACVEGTWQEIVTQAVVGNVSAADGNATTPGLGGSVAYEQTYVILPDAAIVAVVADGVEGGKKSTDTAVIAVVVIVVFVVALVLVGVCCWMRRKKQHVEVGFDDGTEATQGGATSGTTEVDVMMEVEN